MVSQPREQLSFEQFRAKAEHVFRNFRPTGFRLVDPQEILPLRFTHFPKLSNDQRGVDGLNGKTDRPSHWDFYYLSDTGALVELSLIYAPWASRDQGVIYWNMYGGGLGMAPADADKIEMPYMIQMLVSQNGYLVRVTWMPAQPTGVKEGKERVSPAHEAFVQQLDEYLVNSSKQN